MNNEMIVRIKVISKPQTYWTTTNPVIPVGSAAHVIGNDSSTVRVGNGVLKYSELTDTHLDSFVAAHASIHAADGRDPLLATDAEVITGTATKKAPTVKQMQTAIASVSTDVAGVATNLSQLTTTVTNLPNITASTGAPSGGKPGDVWIQYIP